MSSEVKKRVPWVFWPFYAVWRLASFVLGAAGILVCAVLGVVLMVVGAFVTVTIVGAPLGIPLVILGLLLLVRAIF